MKKLIATAILAAILPAYLASAEDNNNGNPPDGKPKQHQGGKCHGKDGNGKPKKKGKPGADDPQKNNQ
jgi:hypothetical protein